MHVFFWQMTWAMIHKSLQTQGGKHQTSDPPLNPSYKGILQTWKQRGVWLTKAVQKEGHVHLLLMGLKIFYLGKVTARQE